MTLPPLYWYRVTVDGAVSYVLKVDDPDPNTPNVFYVKAESEDHAAKLAQALYLARQREALRARRAALKAQGKCRCGGEITDPEFTKCWRCREKNVADTQRHNARKRGETVVTPSKSVSMAETRLARERELRVKVLKEVRQAFKDAESTNAFVKWLKEEIEKG